MTVEKVVHNILFKVWMIKNSQSRGKNKQRQQRGSTPPKLLRLTDTSSNDEDVTGGDTTGGLTQWGSEFKLSNVWTRKNVTYLKIETLPNVSYFKW